MKVTALTLQIKQANKTRFKKSLYEELLHPATAIYNAACRIDCAAYA
jgi:hypothetical protein